jgi:hypothetical protein
LDVKQLSAADENAGTHKSCAARKHKTQQRAQDVCLATQSSQNNYMKDTRPT